MGDDFSIVFVDFCLFKLPNRISGLFSFHGPFHIPKPVNGSGGRILGARKKM
jgi:hypothetical protein